MIVSLLGTDEPKYPCFNRALIDAGHAVIIDFTTNEREEQSPQYFIPNYELFLSK